MPSRLANKVAIITGSSSGIGRSISLHYAAEGALVVCADLQPDPSPANNANPNTEETEPESQLPTHALITQRGGTAIFQRVDVRSAPSVEELVTAAVGAYGRLDVMVNNAGVGVPEPRPIWECETEAWERVLDVNLKGVFLGIKYACRQMLKQEPLEGADGDRGWIINAASILGFTGQTGVGEYCASKSAVVNLTKSAALDCAPHRIHVNAFAPGYTGTAMTLPFFEDEATRGQLQAMHPFRGLGRPQDLARVCVFLASEDAGWVTGTTIPVDGGFLAGRF